jgi:DNA helicase-4
VGTFETTMQTPTRADVEAAAWSGKDWSLSIGSDGVVYTGATGSSRIAQAEVHDLRVRRRWLRWHLEQARESLGRLRGLHRSTAAAINLGLRRLAHASAINETVAWHAAVFERLEAGRRAQRWIHREVVDGLVAGRPTQGLLRRLEEDGVQPSLTEEELEAVRFPDADLEPLVAEVNEEIVTLELESREEFFGNIEKTPLTEEQSRAVVCFDNRVQLLAAAGSGKTSVMVGRAAYAVQRGFVAPDRILALAFNRAATSCLSVGRSSQSRDVLLAVWPKDCSALNDGPAAKLRVQQI